MAYARILVYHDNRPLSNCSTESLDIPSYLKKSRHVLTYRQQHRKKCDNLCVFEAISQYLYREKKFKYGRKRSTIIENLLLTYCTKKGIEEEKFEGIKFEEIPELERILKLPLNIYEIEEEEENGKLRGSAIYLSKIKKKKTKRIHLIRHDNHIMYCTSINALLKHYDCIICEATFDQAWLYTRHVRKCTRRRFSTVRKQKAVFHSGERYRPSQTIFERIQHSCKMQIPQWLKKKMRFIITWDIETYNDYLPTNIVRGKQTESIAVLKPFVIGAATNHPSFTDVAIFYIDKSDDFILDFIIWLEKVSKTQFKTLKKEYQIIFKKLQNHIEVAIMNRNNYGIGLYTGLKTELIEYLRRIPVIGYNSGKFDSRVMSNYIIPCLIQRYEPNNIKILTKGSTYVRIETPNFVFIDQMNYIAGKKSLDNYMYSVLGKHFKSKLPYGWLKSLSCLEETKLPPYEDWYSLLREHNILEADHDYYLYLLEEGQSEEQALKTMNLIKPPPTGQELLIELQNLWESNGFKTFRDFLSYYLTQDVKPFLDASERQLKIFQDKYKICIYRDYVSLSSIAIKIAFSYLDAYPVFVPAKELYQELAKTPGGQSIIFQREAIGGITKIRPHIYGKNAETMQSIFSLDASLMYGEEINFSSNILSHRVFY